MSTLFYPPSIDWELTTACNHNCIHCYNYWRTQDIALSCGYDEAYYRSCAQKIVAANPVSLQDTFATAIGKMTQWQDGSMLSPECKSVLCTAILRWWMPFRGI